MYGSVLSVLSEEFIVLIRVREPALELCRLTNIGDCEKASLETVRILSLPELTKSASLRWATCFGRTPRTCALLEVPSTTSTRTTAYSHSPTYKLRLR